MCIRSPLVQQALHKEMEIETYELSLGSRATLALACCCSVLLQGQWTGLWEELAAMRYEKEVFAACVCSIGEVPEPAVLDLRA